MLNPPLADICYDLLDYIVEHVSKLPWGYLVLRSLSLADRAFTPICQRYLLLMFFQNLVLSGTNRDILHVLGKKEMVLKHKPSFFNSVRVVKLAFSSSRNKWLFKNPTFVNTFQQLAKSPRPPHGLYFGERGTCYKVEIKDPVFVVKWLAKSFFSQTLTTLHLINCKTVPLPLFLLCPLLRDVLLESDGIAEASYDRYPDDLCSGREPPTLEVFDYFNSHSVVKQMITPPPRFHSPVVLLSQLRVLTLSPHFEQDMACLQPILDAACDTLEELFLTHRTTYSKQHLPLFRFINLGVLSRLHVFALYDVIKYRDEQVLHDINTVLGTIPVSNQVTNLSFKFLIDTYFPISQCLNQEWVGIRDEVVRISADKPLELDLTMVVNKENGQSSFAERIELYARIKELTAPPSGYPKICSHFWDPTCGIAVFPQVQVRRGCRR